MSMRSQADGTIRVALIGYGRAGQTFHTPLLQLTPGFELAVVVSSRPAQVRADLAQATVVALKDAFDVPFEEISEATGLPVGTAKCYAHRGRNNLRARLGGVGSTERRTA